MQKKNILCQIGIIVPSRLHKPNVFQQRLANTLNDGLRSLLLRATARGGSNGRHATRTEWSAPVGRSVGRLEGQSIQGRAGLGTLGRQVADVTSTVRHRQSQSVASTARAGVSRKNDARQNLIRNHRAKAANSERSDCEKECEGELAVPGQSERENRGPRANCQLMMMTFRDWVPQ